MTRELSKEYIARDVYEYDIFCGVLEYEEVVRCKDCKHTYLMDNLGITGKWLMCKGHVGNTYRVSEDDFCSWGERKQNETD